MNLDQLMQSSGEWLRGTGPDHDIVVSTPHPPGPQPGRVSLHQPRQRPSEGRDRVDAARSAREARTSQPKLDYVSLPPLVTVDRQFLVERQLISRELASSRRARAASPCRRPRPISVMVNEEDHLRLQVLRSGFALDDAWQEIDRLDDALEQKVNYAFSEEFGYLTACPTNVGTGMRASVMLHLPALDHDQADREGLPGPAEDQPRRPRPLRRGQPGVGRLLPDLATR